MRGLDEKEPCEVCKQFAERRGEEPDCEACLPELWPECRQACEVWHLVGEQVISGPKGMVGLNHLAIHKAMDLLGVEDRLGCLKLVQGAFRRYMGEKRQMDQMKQGAERGSHGN